MHACAWFVFHTIFYRLDEKTPPEEIRNLLEKLNCDNLCDGIIMQLPLPSSLNLHDLNSAILPMKDVDCLTAFNQGLLSLGKQIFSPCTPLGCEKLIDLTYNLLEGGDYVIEPPKVNLSGKTALVVGRSNLVGKPMAQLLLQRNCSVVICHSKTQNLLDFAKIADIVILATGSTVGFSSKIFKKNSIVIDVGITQDANRKLRGDLIVESTQLAAYTPVPGGVGPVTVQMFLEKTFIAFKHGAKTPINRIS
ncbi:MAG: bifunctional 5,10-methylenetetrahydrofolate dehydrogenase/5,10-methenyltetrahydrofolate cyclohydrolase [Deltaproteobacteria bacterium]|nr:bifunctional 5,10-methylenetetrahydrofolate dehydrogenase/5,10-methenyltetrahydrofolate cyclohydrolase [Deltaproteobacteria bacterium]